MNNLLIPCNLEDNSKRAIKVGLQWAASFSLSPVFLHVISSSKRRELVKKAAGIFGINSDKSKIELLRDKVENEILASGAIKDFKVIIEEGDPVQKICDVADQYKPDLIILGTRERDSLIPLKSSGTTAKLFSQIPYPILAVRDIFSESPKRIIYLCDFSSTSVKAWHWIKKLDRVFHCEVEIFHIVTSHTQLVDDDWKKAHPDYETDLLLENAKSEALAEIQKILDANPKKDYKGVVEVSRDKHAGEFIAEKLKRDRPHLVVMGTHDHSGLKKWTLGSNANYLLNKSDCSFLIVKT